MTDLFKPQFCHVLIRGGHFKRKMIGGKSYNGAIIFRNKLVKVLFGKDWKNNKRFRTATEAEKYADDVVKRYGRLVAAKIMYMMNQEAESEGVVA